MFCFFAASVTLTSLASSLPAGASMGNTFEIHLLVDIRENWNHCTDYVAIGKHRYWKVVAWIDTEKQSVEFLFSERKFLIF